MASKPTRVTRTQPIAVGSSPSRAISEAIRALPTKLAAVPSRLMAPSVPGGTALRVVINRVWRPQRLPISLPKVSANLAAKLAAKPTSNTGVAWGGRSWVARANTAPVAAEPQTFSGPRRPPLASARPRACLLRKPSLVTIEPRAK